MVLKKPSTYNCCSDSIATLVLIKQMYCMIMCFVYMIWSHKIIMTVVYIMVVVCVGNVAAQPGYGTVGSNAGACR